MQTVDIHSHLLNPNVKFDRFYDKIALRVFGKRFGLDLNRVIYDPYQAYIDTLIGSIKDSKYISRSVVLPVDSKFDKDGIEIDRDPTVCSHSADVLRLAQKYPKLIIPFCSVNPNRKDALELIEKYHAQGAKGMKFLQNYWEVDLNNRALIPYYNKLAELKLPLIIHIGSEFSVDSNVEYERATMLKLPLESGVTVIAAHVGAGHNGERLKFWQNLSRNPKHFNEEYLQIIEMMKHYKNLYADISALLTPFKARVLRDLSNRGLEERLLFGTDFPVVFSVLFNTYDLSWSKRWELSKINNPLDRYTQTIMEYFPKDSPIYSNYQKLFSL
ncbi:MAG: amidohydrolase family protein [Campylobacterota bacterium]|nr:amidohydrolase family protein [Campylobacterota bacterium]